MSERRMGGGTDNPQNARSTAMPVYIICVWTYEIEKVRDGTYYSHRSDQQVNLQIAISKHT